MRLRSAALSDVGRVRVRNEDRCLRDDLLGVYGVADGVGGLPGGAEAASIAHDVVLQGVRSAAERPDLRQIVGAAARAVIERGRAISPETGIATTLTVAVFRPGQAILAHIGDSRCYRASQGSFDRLTQDHLEGHALSRCLGHPLSAEPDIRPVPLRAGDRFLFCTDGVTRGVTDDELAVLVEQAVPPATVAEQLIHLALRRGGLDNASAVVVFLEP